jgi:hypothetical protein
MLDLPNQTNLSFFNRRGNSMKKSVLALAVAAALPLVANAGGADLSGSVTVKYSLGKLGAGAIDTDASLSISSSELLASGVTATAEFDVLNSSDNSSAAGTISLSSEQVGTLTAGKVDADGAFQAGDVAELFEDTQDVDDVGLNAQGVHYAHKAGGFSFEIQTNASTDASGEHKIDTPQKKGSQVGISFDSMSGLKLGGSWTNAAAVNKDSSTDLDKTRFEVDGETNGFGASYTFGDLVVKVGKRDSSDNAKGSVTYTATMDDIKVEATAKTVDGKGGHKLVATYTMDSISLTATAESDVKTLVEAEYTSGDVTLTADSLNTVKAVLDLGNADLTLERKEDVATTVTYKVSF